MSMDELAELCEQDERGRKVEPVPVTVKGEVQAVDKPAGGLASYRAYVGTQGGQIAGKQDNRRAIIIVNDDPTGAAPTVAIGTTPAVTLAGNGNLRPGRSITLQTTAPIYGIATVDGTVLEVFVELR